MIKTYKDFIYEKIKDSELYNIDPADTSLVFENQKIQKAIVALRKIDDEGNNIQSRMNKAQNKWGRKVDQLEKLTPIICEKRCFVLTFVYDWRINILK